MKTKTLGRFRVLKTYDIFTLELIWRRASYPCYKKYGINKFELRVLSCLYGYLRAKGKTVCGQTELFKQITANSKEKGRMVGGIRGLNDKGCLAQYEYKRKPGSVCWAISPYGFKVLELFEQSIDVLYDKFKPFDEYEVEEEAYYRRTA